MSDCNELSVEDCREPSKWNNRTHIYSTLIYTRFCDKLKLQWTDGSLDRDVGRTLIHWSFDPSSLLGSWIGIHITSFSTALSTLGRAQASIIFSVMKKRPTPINITSAEGSPVMLFSLTLELSRFILSQQTNDKCDVMGSSYTSTIRFLVSILSAIAIVI